MGSAIMEFGDSPKLTPEYFLRLLALQRRQEDEAAVAPRPVSREVSDIAELGQTAQRPYYRNEDPGYSHQQDAIESQRRAAEYELQADQPMERPRGLKENAVSGIRAFIEGMAQPKSPFAGIERREDQYSANKAQTLARAKELRAQAMQQQQIGRGVSADAAEGERHAQTMDFNKKRQAFDEQVANRPRGITLNPGDQRFTEDPTTGVATPSVSVPDTPPKAPTPSGIVGEFLSRESMTPEQRAAFDKYQNDDANRKRVPPPATIQIMQAGNPSSGMPTDMSDAFNKSTANMQPNRRAQFGQTVNAQFGRGDINAAKETIRQAALEGEAAPVRAQALGRRELISSLSQIDQLLNTIPQGLVTGTIEDIARKLGTSTDPNMVKVGSRLTALNQTYRRAITGAAFSAAESSEYVKLLPEYTNNAPVNKALIQGLLGHARSNDATFWHYKLGPGWSDESFSTPTGAAAPTGGAGPRRVRVN
jgi:hypothetical protein